VSWSPASVSLTIGAGGSTTTSSAFTASKALSNVTVAASSSISGFVTPTPTTVASVAAGTPVTVSLAISIPRSTTPGTYTGAINISAPGKITAKPLPVTITVAGTCTPGAPGCPWQNGDLTTYTQNSWTVSPGSTTMANGFNQIYTTGTVEVGGNHTMAFTTATHVLAYIPASGVPAALTGNLLDPTSSPSGAFGGDVLALQLDADFSDAGLLQANSGLKFGDLTICNLTTVLGNDVSGANGMTVRQLLAEANTALGGGTTALPIDSLDSLARSLNSAFDGGTPSSFAQNNLVNGSCP
jgi:hypothetical protein